MNSWVLLFIALALLAQLAAYWLSAKRESRFLFGLIGTASIAAFYLLATGLPKQVAHSTAGAKLADSTLADGHQARPAPAAVTGQGPAGWLANRDAELYAPRWEKSKVVKRILNKREGNPKPAFSQRTGMFTGITNEISSLELLGSGTSYYAGIAIGDVNQDGYIDVVFSHPGSPVSLLLNDRQGGFSRAPADVFAGGVPYNAEWVALADVNADSHLDLLVIASQYGEPRRNILYLFDPAQNRYVDSGLDIGIGKRMVGGVSFVDYNQDGTLDFFISFGADWESDDVEFLAKPSQDEFFLSGNGGWRESLDEVFPKIFTTPFVGMTALFVDADRDGQVDFLLGNDMFDPSITLFGAGNGQWAMAGPDKIDRNTINSMSFYPIDVDNDGVFELWENGTGKSTMLMEQNARASRSSLEKNLRSNEFYELHLQFAAVYRDANRSNKWRSFECDGFVDEAARSLCWDWRMAELAWDSGDVKNCNRVVSRFMAAFCRRNYKLGAGLGSKNSIGDGAMRSKSRLELERYPLQVESNVLLKRTDTGFYRDTARQNVKAALTGWSWGAYPFDIDNDGRLDLYIGTGYLEWAHDVNRLLFNRSTPHGIQFVSGEVEWGVDFEDETRGIAIADFDRDGDGDLVMNNYLSPPRYLENQGGGSALSVELRSHSNYYAIGSVIELHTKNGIQTRPVAHGGVWNSSLPMQQHFGVATEEKNFKIVVTWPNGKKQTFENIEPGFQYVLYE